MEMNEFIQEFAGIFEDVNVESLGPQTKFREIDGWDSITLVALIALISDEFQKEVTPADIRTCNTIEDVYNLIK